MFDKHNSILSKKKIIRVKLSDKDISGSAIFANLSCHKSSWCN